MLKALLVAKRKLAFFGALGVLGLLQGAVSAEEAACGTCWIDNPGVCIIDGIKVDNACDGATPGCYPKKN